MCICIMYMYTHTHTYVCVCVHDTQHRCFVTASARPFKHAIFITPMRNFYPGIYILNVSPAAARK